MILQALTRHYEELLALGKITPPGWAKVKVSYALELTDDGSLLSLLPLQTEQKRKNKSVWVPQELEAPMPVKRSSGVAANFLCDNSSYLLGIDQKGNPKRTCECFAACKALHLALLQNATSPAARAVFQFFSHWDPAYAGEHPAMTEPGVLQGGNLVFWYKGQCVNGDPQLREIWQKHYDSADAAQTIRCLVTGRREPLAQLHPNIKGVQGAQSSGATLVSFNAPAFCSYGHEQGANAPVGSYAAFAYTTALNHLIADREHIRRVGDTTLVCWAEGGKHGYQECFIEAMFRDTLTELDVRTAFIKLANGDPVEWNDNLLDPSTQFYVLGLAPNAARLSVRFFLQNSFGALARNIKCHYDRLNMIRPSFEKFDTLPIWRLLQETTNKNARNPAPSPQLAGELLRAVLTGGFYPATLLQGITLRIRAEQKITWGRAAGIKAYYLRNSKNALLKEVMTVELNEQSNYLPYVLGRLFSVLEAVQEAANPTINSTIKDRYFNSASASPAFVFPLLINLAEKHLAKLQKGHKIYYSRQIADLVDRIQKSLPKRLALDEQGAFQIGYYHQTQKRFTKKGEQ